ncbi:MAG: aldehyde dehydrogenase family protein [Nitrospirae bacterium]|nr:MAG: aldehyde dehydrogenase family protein [Nitrospirota bacterium]
MVDYVPFFIGTQRRSSPECVPVSNPYTGEVIAHVCQATASDVEEALCLAVQASSALASVPTYVRAHALASLAEAVRTRQEDFAQTITRESGKPITDARREVNRAIQTFLIASEEAKRLPGEVIPLDLTPGTEHHLGLWQRVPIGPVLGITPFNFPLNLVAHKVAPCVAAGNPLVLKPAPQTPLTALLLGEVFQSLDLPSGTLSILPCSNARAEAMVQDARFQAFSFTGSAAVGWMLKERAGKKRALLELGGNAGVIIEPDADLDFAAKRCAAGGFAYSGQTCIAVQRVFVHEQVYDAFVHVFLDCVKALPCGDPLQESTVVGPLIDERAAQRVETWIREAVAQGASILTGGMRQGAFIAPTVLAEVTPEMKVSCEEVFGPVVTITRYHEFDHALQLVNESPYGLQAGVFTNDVHKIFKAYRQLAVGAVLANEIPTFRADHMPYGGVKDSGLGREGVRYAITELTELKLLVLNLPPH